MAESAVDRRFLYALGASLAVHLLVVVGPAWRLPGGEEVHTTLIEARLAPPKQLAPPAAAPAVAPEPAVPKRRSEPLPQPTPKLPQARMPDAEPPRAAPEPTTPATPAPDLADAPVAAAPAATESPAAVVSTARDQFPAQGRVIFAAIRGAEGFVAGTMEHVWKIENGRYLIMNWMQTTGLVALFKSVREQWRSEGEVSEKGFVPGVFRKERDGKMTDAARFDRAAGNVMVAGGGRHFDAPMVEGSQDFLSVFYQLAMFPPQGDRSEIWVATGRSYNAFVFERVGEESLKTRLGEFTTLHLRSSKDANEVIDIWLALDYSNLPLRIRWTQRDGTLNDFVAIHLDNGKTKLVAPEPERPGG